ncbi:hypothetical protein JYT16_01245 [Gemmatimonas aurantiaca]|nr:hypothetical protein [Gemmatimonas aurantiaca]
MSKRTENTHSAMSEISKFKSPELRGKHYGDSDNERRFWGKVLLKKWTIIYLTLWAFLTVTLIADNEPIYSSLLAMVLAFGGATLITLFMGAALVVQTRSSLGRISAEEKLVAAVFVMALCTLYPFCWYFRLGWSVALALTLLLYQSLVILSRNSAFSEKILTGDSAKLFPGAEDEISTVSSDSK